MCEVPVFYASTEGQTRRIAGRIADEIRKRGLDSRAIAIGSADAAQIEWPRIRGVAVGASVHVQKHQAEALQFARAFRRDLAAVPSLFFSVSLAAASKNASEVQAAERLAYEFVSQTGWQASRVASVAGRLAYTQYNWFIRLVMRRIAKKEGASLDTTRDHEYTDWQQVDRLADDLATRVQRRDMLLVAHDTRSSLCGGIVPAA